MQKGFELGSREQKVEHFVFKQGLFLGFLLASQLLLLHEPSPINLSRQRFIKVHSDDLLIQIYSLLRGIEVVLVGMA